MLILASGSPRRRDILSGLGLKFEVRAAKWEPLPAVGEGPRAYALRSARAKTAAVAAGVRANDWVIGADTIVAIGENVLGKPVDDDDARRMLYALSGRVHQVTTAFCVFRGSAEQIAQTVTTRVVFAPLSNERVERYVATGEGRDKAGAYAIQGLGMALIRTVDGSYSNVVGLPAAEILEALEQVGAVGA